MPPAPPPPGSQVIIMDIPRIVAEATRAASEAGVAAADPKVRAMIDKQIEQQLAANQQGLKAMAAALSREAAARTAGERDPRLMCRVGRSKWRCRRTAGSSVTPMPCSISTACCAACSGFARRDQGEIPFAIDRQGALYTPEASDKSRLEALGVERTAAVRRIRHAAPQRRLDHRVAPRAERDHFWNCPTGRGLPARDPARVGAKSGPRSAGDCARAGRHHSDLAPNDAASRDA